MLGKLTAERLTAFFTAIIAVTGVAALAYAHWQLRESHEEAQVQHLLAFDHEFRQEPMISYRKSYATKRLVGVEDPPEETRLLDFFETIGLLVNHGYLSDTDVWETFGIEVMPLYADARDMIEQHQKTDPTEYTNFVSLAQRVEAIEQERHGALVKPSKDDIKEFWQEEAANRGRCSNSPTQTISCYECPTAREAAYPLAGFRA
jgi:hypothetical protein